jgi:predicted HicB family RNase H-like nuclease
MNTPNYKRTSQRVSITIPFQVHERICTIASEQGRSHSNLMAYMLERAVEILFPGSDPTRLG